MDYDEFVEIPDFPGYYINKLGIVISYKYGYRKELKITPDHKGYLRVCLMKGDGKTYVRFIHRLLAELFIPNPDPENFKLVRHLDDDKTNNALSNLAWGSDKENYTDALKNNKSRRFEIYCYETNTIYESSHDAERNLGIENSHIVKAAAGLYSHAKGYHFCFADDIEEKLKNKDDWIVIKKRTKYVK